MNDHPDTSRAYVTRRRFLGLAIVEGGKSMLAGPFHQGADWTKSAQPDLVDKFESNADATLWRLHFRPDAKFSDGTPITADDVKFSWDHVSVFRDKADAEDHGYVFRPWG